MREENVEWLKERLARAESDNSKLNDFKRLVHNVVDALYLAILWAWIVLGLASPLAAYYRPIPQDGFVQGLVIAGIFWFLFAMAHGLKAVGRLKRE